MRDEYDLSQSVASPYVEGSRSLATTKVDDSILANAYDQAAATDIPCQRLISLSRKQCAGENKALPVV